MSAFDIIFVVVFGAALIAVLAKVIYDKVHKKGGGCSDCEMCMRCSECAACRSCAHRHGARGKARRSKT